MRAAMAWRMALTLSALASLPLGAQVTGYQVTRSAAVVEGPTDWAGWTIPPGSFSVAADGAVEPMRLRRGTNAMLDAATFETVGADQDTVRGGIRNAGSNQPAAMLVMDGNPATCWEPDPLDPLDQWYLEIDLGRSVIAERVVVRFAAEGAGDPFLKFRVLLADGRTQIRPGREEGLQYFRCGQVTRPNKEQRTFEFEVTPQHPVPEGEIGEVVQVIRFEALDTDSTRAWQVDQAQYQALEPADRGATDYYRQTATGRQILVDEQTWKALPAVEQGEVRRYRRERPRLAEIEVYTPGDNVITFTQRLRNRDITLIDNLLLGLVTDGQFRSLYPVRAYDPVQDRNQVRIDLGARFWLDRVTLLTAYGPLPAYQVRLSNGDLDAAGSLVWQALDERLNQEMYLRLEERFPLQEVRYVELKRVALVAEDIEGAVTDGNLSELQAYGEGFVSEVTLDSPLIKLGQSRMFTTLSWDGEAPPGTELEIRTRSGDDLVVEEHYYNSQGQEISKARWESARETNRGPVERREVPGPGWSNWSAVYQASGQAFLSFNPRRLVQVQARLLTREPLRCARLRRLVLGLSPPLADQALAEVWPVDGVAPGQDQEFTLYLRPIFATGDLGFDRLRLTSSSSAALELVSLRTGSEASLRAGGGRVLYPGPAVARSLVDGGVEIDLPEPVTRGTPVYEARFRGQVFLSGTTFGMALARSSLPGVEQTASEGDATGLVASQSLVAVADVAGYPLLDRLAARPSVFTPNGDGVNDLTAIEFAVYRLVGEERLEVTVFDLAGRRVRSLSATRANPSGTHAIPWDGRDEQGRLVPPGHYLVRVGFEVDAAGRTTQAVCLVAVAY